MNLYDEEIDGALQDFDTFPEMRDSLTVKDEVDANRYMRVCQHLDAELAQLKAVKDAEFERIACYYNAKAEALEEKKAFFERLVIGFYNYQRAKNPRYQLKTPWGKVVQRKTKSPTWKNEGETVEWLKATGRGELVKIEESLKKADLKKAFTVVNGHYVDESTGEIVPGVTVEGLEHVEYLPVMDNRNQSIPLDKITSMNVNKSIQRALTKAIARHGLGLFIYAGEDLPEDFVERLGKRSNDIYKKFLKEGFQAESIKECMKKAAKAFEADNNPNEVPLKDEEEYTELVAQLLRESANQSQQSEVE